MHEIDDRGVPAQAEVMYAASRLAAGKKLDEGQLKALLVWCRGQLLLLTNYDPASIKDSSY